MYSIKDQREGPYKEYYQNGALKEEGLFKHDRVLMDSIHEYNEDGSLKK